MSPSQRTHQSAPTNVASSVTRDVWAAVTNFKPSCAHGSSDAVGVAASL